MAANLYSMRSMGNCGTWYDDDPPPVARSAASGIPAVAGIMLPGKTADDVWGGGDEAIISSSSLSVCSKIDYH